MQNVSITFLSKNVAEKKLLKYIPFNKINSLDITSRSLGKIPLYLPIKEKRKKLIKLYKSNITDFTNHERKRIKQLINKSKNLIYIESFHFIKIKKNIDWGFSFTFDKYIVLNENSIITSNKVLEQILLHEHIHIIQRQNNQLFKEFYINEFGFDYIPENRLKLTNKVNSIKIYNPDGPNLNWIYRINNSFYLPIYVIDPFNYNQKMKIAIKLISDSNKNIFTIEKDNNRLGFKFVFLNQLDKYPFKNINQNYHPNEIFAEIYSSLDK